MSLPKNTLNCYVYLLTAMLKCLSLYVLVVFVLFCRYNFTPTTRFNYLDVFPISKVSNKSVADNFLRFREYFPSKTISISEKNNFNCMNLLIIHIFLLTGIFFSSHFFSHFFLFYAVLWIFNIQISPRKVFDAVFFTSMWALYMSFSFRGFCFYWYCGFIFQYVFLAYWLMCDNGFSLTFYCYKHL